MLKLATQRNLRVPDDISIAGFDNAPIARHIWPGLTTIAQPVEEMTKQAVTQLITHIIEPQESPYKVILEAKLITRESTAAVK